jgi:hypothetical protein
VPRRNPHRTRHRRNPYPPEPKFARISGLHNGGTAAPAGLSSHTANPPKRPVKLSHGNP